MFDRAKEIDEEYEIINYKVSSTPKMRDIDGACELSEDQSEHSPYNWMILIGQHNDQFEVIFPV